MILAGKFENAADAGIGADTIWSIGRIIFYIQWYCYPYRSKRTIYYAGTIFFRLFHPMSQQNQNYIGNVVSLTLLRLFPPCRIRTMFIHCILRVTGDIAVGINTSWYPGGVKSAFEGRADFARPTDRFFIG